MEMNVLAQEIRGVEGGARTGKPWQIRIVRVAKQALRLIRYQLDSKLVIYYPGVFPPLKRIADNSPPSGPVSELLNPNPLRRLFRSAKLVAEGLPDPLAFEEMRKIGYPSSAGRATWGSRGGPVDSLISFA